MAKLELFGLQAKEKPLVGKFARLPVRHGGCHGRTWSKIVDQNEDFIRIDYAAGKRPRWIKTSDATEIRDRNGSETK